MMKDMTENIERQEALLVFERFTNEDALRVGNAAVALARSRGQAVSVEIVLNGWTVFLHAMCGTRPENNRWMRRKRQMAELRGTSSLLAQKQIEARGPGYPPIMALDPADYSDKGGAFPIRVGGQMIGTLTVSGLTDVEDHQTTVDVLAAELGVDAPSVL